MKVVDCRARVVGKHRPSYVRCCVLLVVSCGLLAYGARAFSLLGPFADWMDVEKGYRQADDIGGPMNIGEGYRWNVPVITYGFDRSFLDYFGSNGVVAVEEAISMLNELPPASAMNLEAYALHAWRVNWAAESQSLMDLKSRTLGILLEQMGLADPVRYMFCIRDFREYPGPTYIFSVIVRNFDSLTAQPSHYINETLFTFQIPQFTSVPTPGHIFCDAQEFPVDSLAVFEPVVSLNAFYSMNPYGRYVTNLTREDVAGLRYLLNGDQMRREALPSDVRLVNGNVEPSVVTADRPGLEKITFVRHPFGPLNGQFLPFTNRWTDVYYDFFVPGYQEVERITTRPDILFTAKDLGPGRGWERTGTTNWVNNADLNGNFGGDGPGVIQGPVIVSFNSVGPFYYAFSQPIPNSFPTELNSVLGLGWGSFNGASNAPILYPAGQQPFQPTEVHVGLVLPAGPTDLHWPVSGRPYGRFVLQTSTNLLNWNTLLTLTNSGARIDYRFESTPDETVRFFRTAPL